MENQSTEAAIRKRGKYLEWKLCTLLLIICTLLCFFLCIYYYLENKDNCASNSQNKGSPCSVNPCLYGGTCAVVDDSLFCLCPAGYTGLLCEVTPCTNTPCLFNGTCTVTGESYVCVCPEGFNGQQCEVPCNTATGYTYDTSMNICYKAVVTSRDYTSAKEQCVSDSAHLLLIDSVDVYGWAVNLMDAYGIQRIYFQAERVDQYSPFLDDEGNNLTYFNWNSGEPDVQGNYLRTDGTTRLMETSSGNSEYSYICQIY